MKIEIPYDKTKIMANLHHYSEVKLMEPKYYEPEGTQKQIVDMALANPIQSKRLCELSKNAAKALIVTNDITRPMPSKITIPALIDELESGNPLIKITILIASGLHRPMTKSELIDKMGSDIVERYTVMVHDAYDKDSLVFKGNTVSGIPIWMNKAVNENELIVAEGFIEAHWLAGFSGGRKSIMPGICGCDTVMQNHGPRNVDHDYTRPGVLKGNPAHEDFCEAASMSGLLFILNVVLDKEKRIINAFAGDTFAAHETGCDFVRSIMEAHCGMADISITSNGGYPLDLNLYQGVKGIDTASVCTREKGVIIMCCGCREGIGHGGFLKVFEDSRGKTVQEVLDLLHRGEIKEYDQWGSQIMLNAAKRFKVIIVSENVCREDVELMFLEHATTLQGAVDRAISYIGGRPSFNVIPEGPVVLPSLK